MFAAWQPTYPPWASSFAHTPPLRSRAPPNHLCRQDAIKILRPNLTVLHVDNCYQLTTVPRSIGNLTKLTWLNLSYNNIERLPPEIGKLRHLERLHVNNNRLQVQGGGGGGATLLTRTHARTHTQELPHDVWHLKDLQELQCDTNNIKALPSGVLEMRSLEKLFVHNNPLLTPEDVKDEAAVCLCDAPPPLPHPRQLSPHLPSPVRRWSGTSRAPPSRATAISRGLASASALCTSRSTRCAGSPVCLSSTSSQRSSCLSRSVLCAPSASARKRLETPRRTGRYNACHRLRDRQGARRVLATAMRLR